MEFCILGLLLYRDMSLYDINLAFGRSLGMFYQASLGSLQIALKKLLASGCIEVSAQAPTGRRKRMYHSTGIGRARFLQLIESDLPHARLEETALSRVHFLAHVPPPARVRVLDAIIRRVEEELSKLRGVLESKARIPDGQMELYRFPFETLDYGIQSHQLALDWFIDLRRRELLRIEDSP